MIAYNAGEEGAVVIGKIMDSKDMTFGYNAGSDKYEDLVAAGVIDPTKVTRTALQNAASIAGLMLTTEAMISEIPEKAPAGRRRSQPRRRRHGRHVLKHCMQQSRLSPQKQQQSPGEIRGFVLHLTVLVDTLMSLASPRQDVAAFKLSRQP